MSFLRFFSPLRAWRDLRQFLVTRKRHEVLMVIPAFILVVAVIFAFYKDSRFEREYEREIIYVKSWPITRSDAEIAADAAKDKVVKDRMRAELKAKQEKRQQEFKNVDDWLTNHGI